MLCVVLCFLLTFACCVGVICIRAPSRLHFGLLSLPPVDSQDRTAGQASAGTRYYGGAGMMIDAPGVVLTTRDASDWSAIGPSSDRALAFARQVVKALPKATIPPQQLTIEKCAPEHAGLGTGTQLGLAVARALSILGEFGQLSIVELARLVGRGLRSALGIHGFAHGGFLVEAGKHSAEDISPLVARISIPETWRIVLVIPSWGKGLHGVEEIEAFARLRQPHGADQTSDALCRLVLLGMLPALIEKDLQTFAESVYELNRQVGMVFAPFQQGIYAHERTAELVDFIRRQGIHGVGQSSWGPAVFAIVEDEERADRLAVQVRRRYGLGENELVSASPWNREAEVSIS